MNKNISVAIIVLIVLIGGSYLLMNNRNSSSGITPEAPNSAIMQGTDNTTADTVMEGSEDSTSEAAQEDTDQTEGVTEVTVTASNFQFDRQEIIVKKGDTVKLTLVNNEGMHDWVVDEFDARTEVLQAGGEETIEFVANEVGEFEYYCSVGNHREMGMVGTLTVEE